MDRDRYDFQQAVSFLVGIKIKNTIRVFTLACEVGKIGGMDAIKKGERF
jgi:hypothetical protein